MDLNIVYVDDRIDSILSNFLTTNYDENTTSISEFPDLTKINYFEVLFRPNDTYESLLHNDKIAKANIIIIDNHLFEENNRSLGSFTGREFKIILKRFSPFVETIIITQDKDINGETVVIKPSSDNDEENFEYYKKSLKPHIELCIKNLIDYKKILDQIKLSNQLDEVLIERLTSSFEGTEIYQDLNKKDIDEIVSIFNEILDEIKHE